LAAFNEAFEELETRNSQISDLIEAESVRVSQVRTANIASAKRYIIIASANGAALLAGISLWSIRAIIRPLREIARTLHIEGAVTSEASEQLATSSQSLAQSASHQAASTEETATIAHQTEQATHPSGRPPAKPPPRPVAFSMRLGHWMRQRHA
jgi:hypothetical protein